MQQEIETLQKHLKKLHAFEHFSGVMYYDMETVMPSGAAEDFAADMGVLGEELYKMQTDPAFKELVKTLAARKDELDRNTRRQVELLEEDIASIDCIPMEEYVAYQMEQSTATTVWQKAKISNDYAAFMPHLAKLIDYNRRFALYYKPDQLPYDTLLNQFEKGMTVEILDAFFADIRQKLQPLVKAAAEREKDIDDSFLFGHFPVEQQRRLSDYIMSVMGIDRAYCAIGEVEHPFTTNFSKHDVRITTHYYEDALASSFYSVVHEGGHALYELHTGDEMQGTLLASGTSMGIHESQSRFFENIIGRGKAFTALVFPKLQELFPDALANRTAEEFYRAVNKSVPSLIRTEADELTYPFHIMIRYEIEKQLFAGTLSAQDAPKEWNRLYKEFLGVEVPDDTHGILQDSHWSGGMFGYFPSYALGSAYGAQFLAAMKKELDVSAAVEKGDLTAIVGWLSEKIYQYGRVKTPAQLIADVCGAPFDPEYYVAYLYKKYSALYNL